MDLRSHFCFYLKQVKSIVSLLLQLHNFSGTDKVLLGHEYSVYLPQIAMFSLTVSAKL